MGKIGILANPASGKDIRRLVSHASLFSNRDKANIVERIISVIGELGEHEIYVMRDADNVGSSVAYKLADIKKNGRHIHIVDIPVDNSSNDTIRFVRKMKELEADVLIALGGDGTSRAVAKEVGEMPFIPVSTGTNNVFPEMVEGTVAGMAAAALASRLADPKECCEACKRIEIYQNEDLRDIALIDLAVSNQSYVGAKALWNAADISRIIATQCHPATIGFSALIGCSAVVESADDFGIMADLTSDEPNKNAAIAAGTIVPIHIANIITVPLNSEILLRMEEQGTLALDGEREVMFSQGEKFAIRLTRRGPRKVDLKKVLEQARQAGLYDIR